MEDLTPYYEIMEQCIAKLGIDPKVCRSDSKKGKWVLRKGSVQVTINIMYIEREDRSYCHIISPIMRIPETKQKELFQELLEINDKLFGVSFSIFQKHIWLRVIRECKGLDMDEAFNMLTRVGNYADQYDDILKDKYL